MKYPLVDIDDVESTKERILLAAVMLFAERGYAAVSVRDIADRVSIKPASLYNHFESKEVLFDTIIETINRVYLDFYDRVDKEIEKAASFAEVLECLFAELKAVYHMFIFYGVALIGTEQFRNEKAREAFNDVYMKVGIDYSSRIFTECIKKEWVQPFDTRGLATFFMNNVFVGSLARAQEDMNKDAPYDATEMFESLQGYMLRSVEIIKTKA